MAALHLWSMLRDGVIKGSIIPLGRARTICHKSHSFTGPSLSLYETIQMAIVSCSVFTRTRLSSWIPVQQMLIIGIYCHEKSDICILPSSRFTVVETSPVNEVRVRFYEVNMHRQNSFERAKISTYHFYMRHIRAAKNFLVLPLERGGQSSCSSPDSLFPKGFQKN